MWKEGKQIHTVQGKPVHGANINEHSYNSSYLQTGESFLEFSLYFATIHTNVVKMLRRVPQS